MVCFVPSVCFSIRKSCQRRDCSELETVRNWVDHCIYYVYRTNSLHSAVGYSSGTGQLASDKQTLSNLFPGAKSNKYKLAAKAAKESALRKCIAM